MTSLASTLVGVLWLWIFASVTGAAIGWTSAILHRQQPWLPSALPSPEDDPSWDEQCLGWWCDDPPADWVERRTGPGIAPDGLAYRWAELADTEPNRLQFLLTVEMTERRALTIRQFIDGAVR